jgi:sporulation protein YlmC with PRC-barrel domain
MNIMEQGRIYTADGELVGRVERVVIDPLTNAVTHVVVRKGRFFTDDKVVPVEAIESATPERIELSPDVVHGELPSFETSHYVSYADDPEAVTTESELRARPLVWLGPYAVPTSLYTSMMQRVVERNIPERAVAVRSGATVFAVDGSEIGDFQHLLATDSGLVTHLVVTVAHGMIRMRKAIPLNWVEDLAEDRIRLGVRPHMVDALDDLGQSDDLPGIT